MWGWNSHSQKWELGVLRDSWKTQSLIAGVKTPRIEVFFILLERSWSVDVQIGFAWAISNICTTSYGQKKGRESNWQFDSRPLKVGNRPDLGVCKWSATHCWTTLAESYKFFSDLIPIRGLNWELWVPKVPGVQIGTISGLLLGSPRTKNHSDVGVVSKRRKYYMGEGGGFPQVRAMVSQVSPCCPRFVPTLRMFPNVN